MTSSHNHGTKYSATKKAAGTIDAVLRAHGWEPRLPATTPDTEEKP